VVSGLDSVVWWGSNFEGGERCDCQSHRHGDVGDFLSRCGCQCSDGSLRGGEGEQWNKSIERSEADISFRVPGARSPGAPERCCALLKIRGLQPVCVPEIIYSYTLVCSVHSVLLRIYSDKENHALLGWTKNPLRFAFVAPAMRARSVDSLCTAIPSPGPHRRLLSGSGPSCPPIYSLAARPRRVRAASSSSALISSASLNSGSLSRSSRNQRTTCPAVSGSAVASAKSLLVRSARGAIARRRAARPSSSSGQSSARCSGVSLAVPQRQSGVGTSGTLRWKRKARRPIFPVRSCVSTELSCFRSPRCFSVASGPNSGVSAGSMAVRVRRALAAPTSRSHRSLQSLSTAASVSARPPCHATAHWAVVSPTQGAGGVGRAPRLVLRRSRFAIAAQASRAFPSRTSRASKSASRRLR